MNRLLTLGSIVLLTACGATVSVAPSSATPIAPPATVSRPESPAACAGSTIDLDDARETCATDAPKTAVPSPDVLQLSMADVTVMSGAPTELRVVMRNAGNSPLRMVFRPGCSFGVFVYDGEGKVANHEGAVMGGICGAGPAIAITLPPDGVLFKRVQWIAARDRIVCEENRCRTEAGTPLAPDTYSVEIDTPFTDAVAGDENVRQSRRASAALTVTANPPLDAAPTPPR